MSSIMKVLNFFSVKQREFNTPIIKGEREDLYPLLIDFYQDSFVISVSKKDEFLINLEVDEVSIEFIVNSYAEITSCITSFSMDEHLKYTDFSNISKLEYLWFNFCQAVENI